jgi:hypothetical protein
MDSISVLATLPSAEHPVRLPRARFSSRALRRAAVLRPAFARARRIARATRGGTYRWAAFRLRSSALETQLEAAVETYLRPDPFDFVYYAEAEALDAPRAEDFAVHHRQSPEEKAAAEGLAARVAALLRARPSLRPFRVRAGWADAVGGAFHGVALVDPDAGEAIWVFAVATWHV